MMESVPVVGALVKLNIGSVCKRVGDRGSEFAIVYPHSQNNHVTFIMFHLFRIIIYIYNVLCSERICASIEMWMLCQ